MRTRCLLVLLFVLAAVGAGTGARAHECTYDGPAPDTGNQIECHESPVVPNWRDGNYVPLFDIEDREDEQQRRDAQRWRDECAYYDEQGRYHHRQECVWLYGGLSLISEHGEDPAPNELHTGIGASHCFLFEAAHQCEDHDVRNGEGVHDKHGGAIYVDLCVTANPESKYCDDGLKDTQAGLTVMDHNPCGTVVPIVACTDEYHVVRPFDPAYTEHQMEDSAEYTQWILNNPVRYLCGKPQYNGGVPWCPSEDDDDARAKTSGATAPTARAATVALSNDGTLERADSRARDARTTAAMQHVAMQSLLNRTHDEGAAATWLVVLALIALAALRVRRIVRA